MRDEAAENDTARPWRALNTGVQVALGNREPWWALEQGTRRKIRVAAWAGRKDSSAEAGVTEAIGGVGVSNTGADTREYRGVLRVTAITCGFQLVTHRNGKRPRPPKTELECIVGINVLVAGPP